MIVTLSKDEVRVCSSLAIERWLTKFGSIDRPNYASGKVSGKLEHEVTASIRANVAEWAVAKAFNQPWSVPWYPNELHGQRKHLNDVGMFEVRTIRTSDAIPFWKKDAGKMICGAKVLDEDYYSSVEIYGCFSADEFMNEQFADPSIGGWRVPVSLIWSDNNG